MEKIEIRRARRKEIGKAIQRLYELTENFEEQDKTGGWLHPCGHCTGCYNNPYYYERLRRVGKDFAFAENSCYKTKFLQWKDEEEFPVEIAYMESEGIWKITTSGKKNREIVEVVEEAFQQALEYAKKEEEKNKGSIAILDRLLS